MDTDLQDKIRQLEAEIEALRATKAQEQPAGVVGPKMATGSTIPDFMESMPWMYYRRPKVGGSSDGWITVGPGGISPSGARNPGPYINYRRKGFEPLDQYPSVPPPASPNGEEVFIPILRAGGVREFPVSQILAHRWHIRPPIPGLRFPQIEAIADEIQHAICPSCEYEEWAGPEDTEIGHRLYSHLFSIHEYSVERAEEVCQEQGFINVRRAMIAAQERERNIKAAKGQRKSRKLPEEDLPRKGEQ